MVFSMNSDFRSAIFTTAPPVTLKKNVFKSMTMFAQRKAGHFFLAKRKQVNIATLKYIDLHNNRYFNATIYRESYKILHTFFFNFAN